MDDIFGLIILIIIGYLIKIPYMDLIVLIISIIVSILAVVRFLRYLEKARQKQKELDARTEQEIVRKQLEEARQQEETRKQEESRKQEDARKLLEEDKKYDRVINCPACKGFGEVYILQVYYGEQKEDESYYDVERRSRFHIVSKDEVKKNQWEDSDGWMHEIYKDKCPHCRGTGSVYAWFEKNAVWSEACKKCNASGKLWVKEKLDIGIGEKEINCNSCNGTGKMVYSKNEIVHIKTKGGWDEEKPIATMENELQENVNIQFAPFEFGSCKPSKPYKFYVTITNKNRDFYSKSQPRQL